MLFQDRFDAGMVLADRLKNRRGEPDLVVLALPRGGVPVGYQIAKSLKTPLEILVVRKLGFPNQPELAMGAIASGGGCVLNEKLINSFRIPHSTVEMVKRAESAELRRREKAYDSVVGEKVWSNVIVVDDGLATGATMLAAVLALSQNGSSRITVAVPCGAKSTCEYLSRHCDEVVCAAQPENFGSVGQWYQDFSQTEDDEVRQLLHEVRSGGRSA